MKKLLILILTVSLVLGGCGSKETNTAEETKSTQEASKEEVEKIMAEYEELVKNESKPAEMIQFIDTNIEKVSQENSDEMINGFEEVQNSYTEKYMNDLFEDGIQGKLNEAFGYPFDKKNIENIQDQELKSLMNEIFDGGFKLVNLEGDYYPFADYEILKKYNSYLSDEMKDYIEVMAAESNELMTNDAAIVISIEELANRTLKSEVFLTKYPESEKRKVVGDLYMMYIGGYLYGSNNTPNFDYETNKISDEVLNSYKKTISENEGTITGDTIKEYLQFIEKNDYKGNDQVIEEANRLYKKTMESLKIESNNNQ